MLCVICEQTMGLLPDTQNCGLRKRRECQESCPRHQLQRKPLVSDPCMHHGTCMTHAPWCTSGSLSRGGGKKTFPAFPAHAQPASLLIWQEAHWQRGHNNKDTLGMPDMLHQESFDCKYRVVVLTKGDVMSGNYFMISYASKAKYFPVEHKTLSTTYRLNQAFTMRIKSPD